jgi:hypothetical protein
MELNDILLLLSLILFAFFIWFFIKKRVGKQRATNEIWREFARMKGLQEQPAGSRGNDVSFDEEFEKVHDRPRFDDYEPFVSFSGRKRDLPFFLECIAAEGTPNRVGKFIISSGEGIKIFTRIRIGLAGPPAGLCVYRKSAWSKLGKVVGMQDIATGDPSFDRLFVVKGKDHMEVLNYLTPSRRMALQDLAGKFWRLELQGGELTLMQPGQTDRMEQLDQYLADIDRYSSALTA